MKLSPLGSYGAHVGGVGVFLYDQTLSSGEGCKSFGTFDVDEAPTGA